MNDLMIYEKNADSEWYLNFREYNRESMPKYNPLPHNHTSYEVYVGIDGSYPVYINGHRYDLTRGDVAFVDRFTPHSSGYITKDEETRCYLLVISTAYLGGGSWLEKSTLPDFTAKHEGYERILELARWGIEGKDTMDRETMCGFISLMLGTLKQYCGLKERTGDKGTKRIVEIMRYINESYRESITLDSLSKTFGYERTYLSRLFNQALGMNLREYLNRCRIAAAVNMKRENPDIPMCKIAAECGFESPNTFYRAYNSYASGYEENKD